MRKYTSSHLYQRIREDFLNGTLVYGERLTELGLCEIYETSRTPLREALIQLEKDGLIERQDNGRINILNMNEKNLNEILHLRLFLETMTLAYAVEGPTHDALLEELAANIEKVDVLLNEKKNLEARHALSKFHEIIYAHANLKYTTKIIQNYNFLLYPLRTRSLLATDRLQVAQNEHKHMLTLVKENRIDDLNEYNRGHLHRSIDKMLERLEDIKGARQKKA